MKNENFPDEEKPHWIQDLVYWSVFIGLMYLVWRLAVWLPTVIFE